MRTRRVISLIVPEENPTGAIYGTITSAALLAAESSYQRSVPRAAAAVVLALSLYWLAHAYAALLSTRLAAAAPLTLRGLGEALLHEWAIIQGAYLPVVVLVTAWAAGAGAEDAELAALVSAALLLVALEVVAAWRSRAARPVAAVHIAAGTVLGIGTLLLRVALK